MEPTRPFPSSPRTQSGTLAIKSTGIRDPPLKAYSEYLPQRPSSASTSPSTSQTTPSGYNVIPKRTMSSHPPPHHPQQPLPPPSHLPYPQHHHPQSRMPSQSYAPQPMPPQSNSSSSAHPSRHLPPLSQSPPYQRHDNTLPPLSPYAQRPYQQGPSFQPPALSRPPSNGQIHNGYPPPQSQGHQSSPPYHPHHAPQQQHHHWDNRQHDPSPPAHHRSESSGSLNNLVRRKSTASENGIPPRDQQPQQSASSSLPGPSHPHMGEDGGGSASDFVKKLAKMLDDPCFAHVVCWGSQGDCFVVKDMTEFTKTILPKMFKHSNFASFVRQLNKYDFHKVKDDTYGDQSWTFKHPDFQRSNRDALENIKRKVPAQRKSGRGGASAGGPSSSALPGSPTDGPGGNGLNNSTLSNGMDRDSVGARGGGDMGMQAQLDALRQAYNETSAQLADMHSNYKSVLSQMAEYQRGMANQDMLMQSLISYLTQAESGRPPTDVGKAIENYQEQRIPLDHTASYSGGSAASSDTLVNNSSPELSPVERSAMAREESFRMLQGLKRSTDARNGMVPSTASSSATMSSTEVATPQSAPFLTSINPAMQQQSSPSQPAAEYNPATGMRVFQAGQMLSREEQAAADNAAAAAAASQEWAYPTQRPPLPAPPPELPTQADQEPGPANYVNNPSAGPSLLVNVPTDGGAALLGSPGGSRLRFRKGAFSPSWAVPPRVLLVDDDQVSRKLFSKFLQVSGCTIDVAVDGIGAVNKMNLEKYDLVLMDIVMPKLDGVTATSLIRQFDAMTPIISMTSNSKPTDVVTYYSSGMNDILPKPFTREGLFTMLEKHLTHLKAIAQLTTKPSMEEAAANEVRLAEESYQNMLNNLLGMTAAEVDGFAATTSALQNGIIMNDPGAQKRMLDSMEDDRDAKRPRFEVVE